MTIANNNYRLLIVDDNEAIHNDLKKILLPAETDADLAADEEFLFGVTSTAGVAFDIDSAFQGQDGLECVRQAKASGMGRCGNDRSSVGGRSRFADRYLYSAF